MDTGSCSCDYRRGHLGQGSRSDGCIGAPVEEQAFDLSIVWIVELRHVRAQHDGFVEELMGAQGTLLYVP